MGYRFQFITLAGWHALNLSMFELASAYREDGMLGYSQMQQREFGQERAGYRATKHQAFVGTGYFDAVQTAITAGRALRRAPWPEAPRPSSSSGRRTPRAKRVVA